MNQCDSENVAKELINKGIKNDSEKIRLDLLSSSWIEGVGKVLTFGAKKYAAHNWRKGIERSRLIGAALRHTFAYLRGENKDPETGLLHLYHASCCLMFASELHETRPDTDDRYGMSQQEQSQPKPNWKPSHSCERHIGGQVGGFCCFCGEWI